MTLKSFLKFNLLMVFVLITAATACSLQQAIEGQKQEKNKRTTEADKHAGHEQHQTEVNERGDRAMGFSHKKTTHRFRLMTEGGAIEVRVNDEKDAQSLEQIRNHLRHVAEKSFPAGDFDAPALTHGKVPPGVPAMQELRKEISYNFEEVEGGGRVLIATKNGEALKAIHAFLRFQIEDHQTGDSTEIEKSQA